MHQKLKNFICASFLAAVTAAGEAEAHGPGDFMYGGHNPYNYPPQHRMIPPPQHGTFLPEVFGPYGLLGQMGPFGQGAPLGPGGGFGGFIDPRFDPRFHQRQFVPMRGMPPVGLQDGLDDPLQKSEAGTPSEKQEQKWRICGYERNDVSGTVDYKCPMSKPQFR
ncbi:MAG TPA: hypothetical protein DEA55_06705 [Rhodospirillaceae bacterium]|nr:hypothetical protein [Rhodospirillaceae bacterium]